MKAVHLLLAMGLISISTATFAQRPDPKADVQSAQAASTAKASAPKYDAQKSFDSLKSLAGTWVGTATTDPPLPALGNGATVQISMRVTSHGNALVHELRQAGKSDYEPTILFVDGDRFMLTHFCEAGNQPRMVAKISPDGKTIGFDLLDITGSKQYGFMHGGVFTLIDDNHHLEDWLFTFPGDKPVHAHMDLVRKSEGGSSSSK